MGKYYRIALIHPQNVGEISTLYFLAVADIIFMDKYCDLT
jgi:hypothetical protein